MSVFEDLNKTTDKASDIGERYIKTSHQYFKLKIFQQLTLSLSMLAKVLAIGGFVFIGVIFLAVSLTMVLGDALGSTILACLIIGILFLIIALLIYMFRRKINSYIIKRFSLNYFD